MDGRGDSPFLLSKNAAALIPGAAAFLWHEPSSMPSQLIIPPAIPLKAHMARTVKVCTVSPETPPFWRKDMKNRAAK